MHLGSSHSAFLPFEVDLIVLQHFTQMGLVQVGAPVSNSPQNGVACMLSWPRKASYLNQTSQTIRHRSPLGGIINHFREADFWVPIGSRECLGDWRSFRRGHRGNEMRGCAPDGASVEEPDRWPVRSLFHCAEWLSFHPILSPRQLVTARKMNPVHP